MCSLFSIRVPDKNTIAQRAPNGHWLLGQDMRVDLMKAWRLNEDDSPLQLNVHLRCSITPPPQSRERGMNGIAKIHSTPPGNLYLSLATKPSLQMAFCPQKLGETTSTRRTPSPLAVWNRMVHHRKQLQEMSRVNPLFFFLVLSENLAKFPQSFLLMSLI